MCITLEERGVTMSDDVKNEVYIKIRSIDSKAALAERKIIYFNIAIESDNKMDASTRAQLKAIVHDYENTMRSLRQELKELHESVK